MSSIRLENSLRPLTDDESQFTGERYKIIHTVMHDYGISDHDCFDELLFYFFNAVQRWFTIPELHQWSFNTIAYHAIEGGMKYYIKKQFTNPAPVSFDAPVEEDGGEFYSAYAASYGDICDTLISAVEDAERTAAKRQILEQIKQRLTARQLEISTLCSNGFTYSKVSKLLGITKGTVGCTMWNIKKMVERGDLVYFI